MIKVRPCEALPAGLDALTEESCLEGHNFLVRLKSEWTTGENRFDRPGEKLLAVHDAGELVGIGGLNRDPYGADGCTGRLRRVYVALRHRRTGLGRRLVGALEHAALAHFDRLVLFTDSRAASSFYQSPGYRPVENASGHNHVKLLGPR